MGAEDLEGWQVNELRQAAAGGRKKVEVGCPSVSPSSTMNELICELQGELPRSWSSQQAAVSTGPGSRAGPLGEREKERDLL